MLNDIVNFWQAYFNFNYGTALLLCIGIFILCATVVDKRIKLGYDIPRSEWLAVCLFSIYMTALIGVTLLNREVGNLYVTEMSLFWSYQEMIEDRNWALGLQILYNILLFIPFGILIPAMAGVMRKILRTTVLAAFFSVFIEGMQLIFRCGTCEIDDIFDNTLGAVIGFCIWKCSYIIWRKMNHK